MHAFSLRLCFLGGIALIATTATIATVVDVEERPPESRVDAPKIPSHTVSRWMNDGLCNAFSVVYAFK